MDFKKYFKQTVSSGTCIADHEGRVIHVDQEFCRIFGYDENELLNIYPPYPFWPGDEPGIPSKTEIKKYFKKNGRAFWGLRILSPILYPLPEKPGVLAVIHDVTIQRQAIHQLVLSEKRLDRLARDLIADQNKEWANISNELHDNIASSLIAIRYTVERKLKEIGQNECKKKFCLEHILDMIGGLVDETRSLAQDLYPAALKHMDLMDAIKSCCKKFQTQDSDLIISHQVDLDGKKISLAMKHLLYLIVQEGLTNAIDHGHATRIKLEINEQENILSFSLLDNGHGFDITDKRHYLGLGIESMKERVKDFWGHFDIQSTPGRGTHIRASWPIQTE